MMAIYFEMHIMQKTDGERNTIKQKCKILIINLSGKYMIVYHAVLSTLYI